MTKNNTSLSLPDSFIRALVTFLAVFVCSGYISTTYLPELSLTYAAVISAIAALVFALPASRGFSMLWGWLAAAVGFGIMFLADREAFICIPDAVLLKIKCISVEIFEFRPDYFVPQVFDCSFDGLAPYVIFLTAFALLSGFLFTRCFYRNKSFFAVLLTVVTLAVSFLGYERANPTFLIFSVMLLCLIWAYETGFSSEHRGNIRFAALTLAFLVIAGVFSLNHAFVADGMRELAADLKLNELKARLSGENGDFPVYLPAEAGGAYASVDMNDVRFADKAVYYAYLFGYGFTGDIYLQSTSYYDFNGTGWDNTTKTMEFKNDALLVDYDGRGRLVRVDGTEANMPYFLWSDERSFENYTVGIQKNLPGYTAHVYLPKPPTDRRYIDSFIKEAYHGQTLKSNDFSQYYESDVNFAAIARSLLEDAGISPEEWFNPYYEITADDIKAAIEQVSAFLSEMKYTTMPTRSENYSDYDEKRSPIYNFLYNTKEGYCVHFATTAALILREMGFTTRYTIGYSFNMGVSGSAEVLDSNSHAWVEIYFEDFGWVPLEMTYGSGGSLQGGDESGAESGETSAVSEESLQESQEESASQDNAEESDSSEGNTSSKEQSESEESTSDASAVGLPNDSSGEALPAVKKEFPIAAVLICLAILTVAVIAVLVTRRIQKKCEKRRRRFVESCHVDGSEAVKAVKADWRFVLGIFKLLGEKPDGSDIMSFAAYVDEKYSDMPKLTPLIMSFLAAEFGDCASAADAKACGEYLLGLNDRTCRRLSMPKRISAYISGKILIPKKKY